MTEQTETIEHAPLIRQFEVDGTTLVYDYSQLRLSQMKLAEAVYQFQADLEKRPPRTFREKIDLGGADYDLLVLSYILLKRLPNGELEPFKGGETQRPILKVIENMRASDVEAAEEVIGDFFARRGRHTLALLVRSKYEIQNAENIMQRAIRLMAQTSEQSSESDASENSTSTTQPNANDASTTA
jgi:hypothetical protein